MTTNVHTRTLTESQRTEIASTTPAGDTLTTQMADNTLLNLRHGINENETAIADIRQLPAGGNQNDFAIRTQDGYSWLSRADLTSVLRTLPQGGTANQIPALNAQGTQVIWIDNDATNSTPYGWQYIVNTSTDANVTLAFGGIAFDSLTNITRVRINNSDIRQGEHDARFRTLRQGDSLTLKAFADDGSTEGSVTLLLTSAPTVATGHIGTSQFTVTQSGRGFNPALVANKGLFITVNQQSLFSDDGTTISFERLRNVNINGDIIVSGDGNRIAQPDFDTLALRDAQTNWQKGNTCVVWDARTDAEKIATPTVAAYVRHYIRNRANTGWAPASTGDPGTPGVTPAIPYGLVTNSARPTTLASNTAWIGDPDNDGTTTGQTFDRLLLSTTSSDDDVADVIRSHMSSTSTIKSTITLKSVSDPENKYVILHATALDISGTLATLTTSFVGRSDENLDHGPVWIFFDRTGDIGNTGERGQAGPGLPTGGTEGQIIEKVGTTNYVTRWINKPAGTGGGGGGTPVLRQPTSFTVDNLGSGSSDYYARITLPEGDTITDYETFFIDGDTITASLDLNAFRVGGLQRIPGLATGDANAIVAIGLTPDFAGQQLINGSERIVYLTVTLNGTREVIQTREIWGYKKPSLNAAGAPGTDGESAGHDYMFHSGTSGGAPNQSIKFNNANANNAGNVEISGTTSDNVNLINYLNGIGTVNNTEKGHIRIDGANGGWFEADLTLFARFGSGASNRFDVINRSASSNTPFADNEALKVQLTRNGDDGAAGNTNVNIADPDGGPVGGVLTKISVTDGVNNYAVQAITGTGTGSSSVDARGTGFRYRRGADTTVQGNLNVAGTWSAPAAIIFNPRDSDGQSAGNIFDLYDDGGIMVIYDSTEEEFFLYRLSGTASSGGLVVTSITGWTNPTHTPSLTADLYVSIIPEPVKTANLAGHTGEISSAADRVGARNNNVFAQRLSTSAQSHLRGHGVFHDGIRIENEAAAPTATNGLGLEGIINRDSDSHLNYYNDGTRTARRLDITRTTELTDVSSTAPTNGQVQQWNQSAGQYEPTTLSTGGGGTTLPTLVNNRILSVNGSGSLVWIAIPEAGLSRAAVDARVEAGIESANIPSGEDIDTRADNRIGQASIGALRDFNSTGWNAGEVPIYNGSEWRAGRQIPDVTNNGGRYLRVNSGSTALEYVVLPRQIASGGTNGQILSRNTSDTTTGTTWIDAPSGGGGSTSTPTDVVIMATPARPTRMQGIETINLPTGDNLGMYRFITVNMQAGFRINDGSDEMIEPIEIRVANYIGAPVPATYDRYSKTVGKSGGGGGLAWDIFPSDWTATSTSFRINFRETDNNNTAPTFRAWYVTGEKK